MGFLDLFRPKWRHSDADVRAEAVRQLDEHDLSLLQQIAQRDTDARVRRIAIKRIDDPQLLLQIADKDPDEGLRRAAQDKAEELLLQDAVSDDEAAAAEALESLGRLGRPRILAEVARRSALPAVKRAALSRISDERVLAEVARAADDPELRREAVSRLTLPEVLHDVAVNAPSKEVGLAAVARISDPAVLSELVQAGKNKAVRNAARERLGPAHTPIRVTRTATEAALETRRRVQLQGLCQKVEAAVQGADLARAAAEVATAREALADLGAGDDPDDKPFVERVERATAQFEARRQAAERKQREKAQADAAAAQQGQKEREEAAARQALCEQVEALSQPSQSPSGAAIPAQIEEARAAWGRLPADALPAERKAEMDRRFAAAVKAAMRRHDTALLAETRRGELEALCQQADKLAAAIVAQAEDALAARRMRDLEKKWRDLTQAAALAEDDPLQARFAAARAQIAERQRALKEQQQAELDRRVAAYDDLATRMAAAAEAGDGKRLPALLKEAQQAQAALGQVPPPRRDELRRRLQEARDKLQGRLSELREEEDWKRWANLPRLEALCVRVEALSTAEDVRVIQKELQAARAEWKALGAPPREKAKPMWERIQKAAAAAQERLDSRRGVLDEERAENLKKKEALCQQAEALAGSTEWKEASEQLKKLQAEWKAIGPVPKEHSDAIWKRFRAACDQFFGRLKEHQGTLSEERAQNQKRLEEICQRAEALARSEEWKETAEQLKRLQAEWKEVGPAGREANEALWKRFRAACDQFFAARKTHFEQLDVERAENLGKKEALCAELDGLLKAEEIGEQEAVEHVRRLNAAWREIGPVPREQADALWARFREGCDKLLLRRWEPVQIVEGESRFENRLPLKDVAERLGLGHQMEAGEGGAAEAHPADKPAKPTP